MPRIEVSEETYRRLTEDAVIEVSDEEFPSGSVFIRTVTYHHIGRVVGVKGEFIKLDHASCVFDSGSLSTALTTGRLVTVEAVGVVWINRNSITDIFPWKHELK